MLFLQFFDVTGMLWVSHVCMYTFVLTS